MRLFAGKLCLLIISLLLPLGFFLPSASAAKAENTYYFLDENGTMHFSDSGHGDARFRPYIPRGRGTFNVVGPLFDPYGKDHFFKSPKNAFRRDKSRRLARMSSDRSIPYTVGEIENIPRHYDEYLRKLCKHYALELHLVKAIIKVESNFSPEAVSPKGAQGMMQLMPATCTFLQVKDPFDPYDNILGGVRYMRYLLNCLNEDVTLALAAYNSGLRTVYRYRDIPPIKETEDYVKRVIFVRNALRRGAI